MNHSRRTKIVSAIAGAASFALLAAGCSSGGTRSSNITSSSGPVTLTVTTFGSMGLDGLHKSYEAAHPGITIAGCRGSSLFTFMMAWTDFLWPMIVAPQNPTLQVALSQLQSARYVDFSVVLAGAVLATLPLLLLFAVAGRQLISGIMAGAVKG